MAEVLSARSASSTATSQQDEGNSSHQQQQPLAEQQQEPQQRQEQNIPAKNESSTAQVPSQPTPREPRPAQALERIPSFAQSRMSSYSTQSQSSRSRPPSVFPTFKSHLSYAQVRDFAYPPFHPNHHGPPPEPPSGSTTPGSERNTSGRRLSDPGDSGLSSSRGGWSAGGWAGDGSLYSEQAQHHFTTQEGVEPLPSTSFGSVNDDEDDSAILSSSGHRKSKSYASLEDFHCGRRRSSQQQRRTSRDQQDMFHFHGSGSSRRDSHSHTHSLPSRSFHQSQSLEPPQHSDLPLDSEPLPSPPTTHFRSSMSPSDEELFAGPSLALYSFEPENTNELKLTEGQTILVSYRHGQGWLVAEDPVSGEQGLVPEEYVRLLREIEGWDEEEGMDVEMGEEGYEEGESAVGVGGEREGKGGGGLERVSEREQGRELLAVENEGSGSSQQR